MSKIEISNIEEMKDAFERFLDAVREVGIQNIDSGLIEKTVYDQAIKVIRDLVFDHTHSETSTSN